MSKARVEWTIRDKKGFPLIAKVEGVTIEQIRVVKAEMRRKGNVRSIDE
jgi:hypothetical protein